jgi:hypothetical protein
MRKELKEYQETAFKGYVDWKDKEDFDGLQKCLENSFYLLQNYCKKNVKSSIREDVCSDLYVKVAELFNNRKCKANNPAMFGGYLYSIVRTHLKSIINGYYPIHKMMPEELPSNYVNSCSLKSVYDIDNKAFLKSMSKIIRVRIRSHLTVQSMF